MTEEWSYMMMMVVPTQLFQQEINHLSGYCFPSMIGKSTNITSDVSKGVLYDCWIEVNEVVEHRFFSGRLQYTVDGVFVFMKISTSLLLKMHLLDGCLLCFFRFLCCSIFCLFLFSPAIIHQSALHYFSSCELYSWTRMRVHHGGLIIYQSHLLLIYYRHELFLHILNRYDCYFSHIVIRCSSENHVTWWLLRTLFSEDNHRIFSTGNL